jgi:hypothetical protein
MTLTHVTADIASCNYTGTSRMKLNNSVDTIIIHPLEPSNSKCPALAAYMRNDDDIIFHKTHNNLVHFLVGLTSLSNDTHY